MNIHWLLNALTADTTSKEPVKTLVRVATNPSTFNWHQLANEWIDKALFFGLRVVLAIILFFLGRLIIRKLTKVINRILLKRELDGVVVSLLNSVIVALLYLFLGIFLISLLGFQSVSFAAVLASMGLAVGMSLSGQLQNLAGGVIIMITKPFKIGDFIDAQDVSGTVLEVTLFHTKVSSGDNKMIFIPNGILSSGVVVNISHSDTRRLEWTVGIEYNEDFERAKAVLERLLEAETRLCKTPAPIIVLNQLSASSVDIMVRAWVNNGDYWDVFWAFNKSVYQEFNKEGIGFPFPQLTIHQAKD